MNKENQAYDHGAGTTKPTTQHDAIFHRMSCLMMDKYFNDGNEHPTDGAPKRKCTDTPAHEDGRAKRVKPR